MSLPIFVLLAAGTLTRSEMLPRFLNVVKSCNAGATSARSALPFVVGDKAIGAVMPVAASALGRFTEIFGVSESGVRLIGGGDSVAARSDAVMRALEALREEGSLEMLRGWRAETWPVKRDFFAEPELLIERAAIPLFGVPAYGCFVNGLVGTDRMWVARRSRDKQTYPGKLDLIAAGGLAHGELPTDNVRKECREEASIPEDLAACARPAGTVSYTSLDETGCGIKRDTLFVYDLELPEGFCPIPADGEVESFELIAIEDVMRSIADAPDDWKPNVALTLIDLFVRRGHISPDREGYLELTRSLRMH
jgi:8-oxo-dGTP pyrophosphatase MutT (NUDIX family)